MIRRLLDRLIREERGLVLPLVLVFLVVGSLIIVPCLNYASTTVIAGRAYRERTEQLYAADAGMEDAFWKFTNDYDNALIPKTSSTTRTSYSLTGLNNIQSLDVTIECLTFTSASCDYKIIATASSAGSSTDVSVYTSARSVFFSYLATSQGDINLPQNPEKVTVQYPDGSPAPINEHYTGYWPTETELQNCYRPQTPYPTSVSYSSINCFSTHNVGPIYRNGNLDITSSDNGGLLTLDGTIYVDGNLTTGNSKTYTIDLNGNTIYVTGTISIVQKCTIKGSGAIISVSPETHYAIDFNPGIIIGDSSTFVFIMAVNGLTNFHPLSEFYGAIAGSVAVDVLPNCTLTLTPPPPGGLNFPLNPDVFSTAVWPVKNWQSHRQ